MLEGFDYKESPLVTNIEPLDSYVKRVAIIPEDGYYLLVIIVPFLAKDSAQEALAKITKETTP